MESTTETTRLERAEVTGRAGGVAPSGASAGGRVEPGGGAVDSARATTVDLWAPLPGELAARAEAVREAFARVGARTAAVAFSGGVDSSVLAALTARALGRENTVLALAVSPSLSRRHHDLARAQADQLGLRLVEVHTREFDNPSYRANTASRCYFCKSETYDRITLEVLRSDGLDILVTGTNADDALAADRPGTRAAAERRVIAPLQIAGITKSQVRAIAAQLGLNSADLPSSPCLASRIPHGTPVDAASLRAVDTAEDAVLAAGFTTCRVRHHGEVARVEVPVDEFHLLLEEGVRERVLRAVRAAGFRFVSLDLDGIQSGAFTLHVLNSGRSA
ncbi:ATP-dependent sacrificial sulfur transferase LarE [Schaalia sp. 19OD2882]|uniref:ATP-dependent sacrificial sulfur transferase LarE n=1 Tax=Schaalia sp. 19OD2882 TaxID=2794089 RepID=UPI001C1F0735|nr:ATP-dependent sacrificial sulfur transferase LarE [Schaalia sp. 19OD2882]QWW19988.1 ATP-dependent sacrificial sulfur transferase LarE [Schaalia sp. 19OD2882]